MSGCKADTGYGKKINDKTVDNIPEVLIWMVLIVIGVYCARWWFKKLFRKDEINQYDE